MGPIIHTLQLYCPLTVTVQYLCVWDYLPSSISYFDYICDRLSNIICKIS